jgi:hypothetical protein
MFSDITWDQAGCFGGSRDSDFSRIMGRTGDSRGKMGPTGYVAAQE